LLGRQGVASASNGGADAETARSSARRNWHKRPAAADSRRGGGLKSRDQEDDPGEAPRGGDRIKRRLAAAADERRITQEGSRARIERAYAESADGWRTRRARHRAWGGRWKQ
jgi:hypothetical protein